MKKEQQHKLDKALLVVNIILVALVAVLFMRVYSLQRQVDGACHSKMVVLARPIWKLTYAIGGLLTVSYLLVVSGNLIH